MSVLDVNKTYLIEYILMHIKYGTLCESSTLEFLLWQDHLSFNEHIFNASLIAWYQNVTCIIHTEVLVSSTDIYNKRTSLYMNVFVRLAWFSICGPCICLSS
jgi:hypothetical protein